MARRRSDTPRQIAGAALHPGERGCVRCGQRIGDADRCVWVEHDATDHIDRFQHLRCPSPFVHPSSSQARALRDAPQVLQRARQAYAEAERLREPLRTIVRGDLLSLGTALRRAVEEDDRIVASGLVLGFREWERAHHEVLGKAPEEA
jgi:hypothetical protein